MPKKIKNWIKTHLPHIAAALALLAGLFTGLYTSKRRRLDTNQQLCESAEGTIAQVTESVERASDGIKSAEETVGELKQSIASSELRLGESQDTVEQLIRNTDAVEAIIDKYNSGIKSTSEK